MDASSERDAQAPIAQGEVKSWLSTFQLERYGPQLENLGYDNLVFLRGIHADELAELMEQLQMPRPHARCFEAAVAQLNSQTAAAPPQTLVFAQPVSEPSQVAVAAPQPAPMLSGGFTVQQSMARPIGSPRRKSPTCNSRCRARTKYALCLATVAAVAVTGVHWCMTTPGSLCRPGPACKHGNSTDHVTCVCDAGWQGALCHQPIPCFGVKCGAHGRCHWSPTLHQGRCECEQNWNGTRCETYVPCVGVDCGPHGMCDHYGRSPLQNGKAKCVCQLGWLGDRCDVDECSGVKCGAHGKCAPVEPMCGQVSTGCGPNGNDPCDCPSNCDPKTCKSLAHPSEECPKKYGCQFAHGACHCEEGWTGTTCETQCCSTFCPWLERHMDNTSMQCSGNCCAGQCCRRRSLAAESIPGQGAVDMVAAADDGMRWSTRANALVPVLDGHGCCGGPAGSGQPPWCCDHCSSSC